MAGRVGGGCQERLSACSPPPSLVLPTSLCLSFDTLCKGKKAVLSLTESRKPHIFILAVASDINIQCPRYIFIRSFTYSFNKYLLGICSGKSMCQALVRKTDMMLEDSRTGHPKI